MLRIAFCAVTVSAVLASANTARGQWFDPSCCAAPPAQCCAPPVVQQCYQTIPVTEYRDVRQTVQRPVIETAYVDQPCTEYRQVCETKTAEIPTCQYQTVTEYRTVQRDMGCWVTQYQCNPRLQPCQYDSRPNLFGFLNRTGYSMRMAFTPPMTATRTWKSNIVAQQVPVQRQVAIRGTQQVSYQVSRMVPHTTTRKVAVNTVRMVAQEINVKQAVTVYKTVPAGTATVWGGTVYGPSTAFGSPLHNSAATALQPTPVAQPRASEEGTATAIRPRDAEVKPGTNRNDLPGALQKDADDFKQPADKPGSSMAPREIKQQVAKVEAVEVTAMKPIAQPAPFASRPSITRVGRWTARRIPEAAATAIANNDK